MTTIQQPRTMEQVVTDIMHRLGALQNVLYSKSARQADVAEIERDVKLLAMAVKSGEELLAASLMQNIEMEKQRDAAINAVANQRAQWIQFAAKHQHLVLAAGVSLDKDGIDAETVAAALDFIAGALKGDVSEGAMWDVARALQRMGEELNQRGV